MFIVFLVVIYLSETVRNLRVSNHKFGTDTSVYGIFLSSVFIKAFDDYVTLHNLSMLLTYIVTLYHDATRDVVSYILHAHNIYYWLGTHEYYS